MPYATPFPPGAPPARPTHRRSRSSFTDERGPGAFASLGSLPRRSSSKKAVFHLNGSDDSPPDHVLPLPTTQYTPNDSPISSFKLSREYTRSPNSASPPPRIDLPGFDINLASVPFPTQSPLPSPSLQAPSHPFGPSASYSPSAASSSLPRTPSTPIILPNGKPLKSSLKSSSSTPSISGDFELRRKHLRAQSAPSTPSVHKNVHFAGDDDNDASLVSIRVFNRTGKPASLNRPAGDETETETEAENGPSAYPFPSFGGGAMPPSSQHILHEIDSSPAVTSPVPKSNPSLDANVFLENITLPRTRPPTLRGTVLVRNLAFEKTVAVRFTLDDWTTTSEVICKHVVSLPGLPPPFPKQKKAEGGDVASKIMQGANEEDPNTPTWDRFSFTIRLEDYEHKLSERTLWLVVRYSVPWSAFGNGGEWWDNNDNQNYRIGFRRAAASPLATPTQNTLAISNVASIAGSLGIGKARGTAGGGGGGMSARMMADGKGLAQQRTFSAPSSLKYTPMTGTLATSAEAAPGLVRSMSSPYPPTPSENGSPSMSPIAAEKTSLYIKRRLSLSNYVAPGTGSAPTSPSTPTSATASDVVKTENKNTGKISLVTPPTTPPTETAALPTAGRPEKPAHITIPPTTTTIIGGMPATIPAQWPSSSADIPPEHETPFSPTSTAVPEYKSFESGLLSPPRSRETSEDGSALRLATETKGAVSGLGLSFASQGAVPHAGDVDNKTLKSEEEGEGVVYPGSSAMGGMSDSSYAAFVRQWCFAQSAPPVPGVLARSPPSSSSTSSTSSSSSTATATPSAGSPRPTARASLATGGGLWRRTGSPSATERNGGYVNPRWDPSGSQQQQQQSVAGYGFPGFAFGAGVGVGGRNQDVGMVGDAVVERTR